MEININIDGQNITSSSDSNVIISLGGTPAGAALEPFSINVSWSGQLPISRGGTGLGSIGTSNQLLRVNNTSSGLEYFNCTTANITETTNLYYTNDRADGRITLQKGAANGIAPLDGSSKIPNTYLPSIALTDVFVVISEAAQLALTAEEGDVAVRTDLNKSYIQNGGTSGTMSDWQELVTPTDSVLSVNGGTGAVTVAITGTANEISVSGGTGLTPTVSIPNAVTFTGKTITGGTYVSPQINTSLNLNYGVASTVVYLDGSKNLVSLENGSGVLTNNGSGVLSWTTPSSGITVGTTTITSGTSNRILYQSAGGVVTQKANFTMDAVATGVLDIPVGLAITGLNVLKVANDGISMGWGTTGIVQSPTQCSSWYGYLAGFSVTGTYNTFLGTNAGRGVGAGAFNICIGATNTVIQPSGVSGIITLGYNAVATASNQGILGSNNVSGYVSDWYFNGVTHTSAYSVVLNACGGSGSDNQGANISYHSGRSTGNKTGGYHSWGTSDAGASGSTLRAITEKARLVGGGDFVLGIASDTKGLVLKSPDGHYWRITVDNTGVLSTADTGTSIPT